MFSTAPSEAATTHGPRVSQPRSTSRRRTRPSPRRAPRISSTSSSTAPWSSLSNVKAAFRTPTRSSRSS